MHANELIGGRIKKCREKLGLKQQDIANALQISPQAVSKWERAENAPDISILVPLAKFLGVSTDHLLGYHDDNPDVFEATVFFSVIDGYAKKSSMMPPKAVAAWANGFFYQLTEAIIHYDGIPVKYMGDTFLCFFSGPHHYQRSIQAAFHARNVVAENLTVALHCGEIYLGSIGHSDYSRADIMGDTVNLAFLVMEWATKNMLSKIAVTREVLNYLDQDLKPQQQYSAKFSGIEEDVDIFEI